MEVLNRRVATSRRRYRQHTVPLVAFTVKAGDNVGVQDASSTREKPLIQRQHSNWTVHRDAFQKVSR